MINEQTLKTMKENIQKLWIAIHAAPEIDKPQARETYRKAFEAYKRRVEWMKELGLVTTG